MASKVTVTARLRPFTKKEKSTKTLSTWIRMDRRLYLRECQGQGAGWQEHQFDFDHVYDDGDKPVAIFTDIVAPLVDKAFEGFTSAVFCYGPSLSGKTHTLFGHESRSEAIVPSAVRKIAAKLEDRDDAKVYYVRLSLYDVRNHSYETKELMKERAVTTAKELIRDHDEMDKIRRKTEKRFNSSNHRNVTTIAKFVIFTVDKAQNLTTKGTLYFVDTAGSDLPGVQQLIQDRLKQFIPTTSTPIRPVARPFTGSNSSQEKLDNHKSLKSYEDMTKLIRETIQPTHNISFIFNVSPTMRTGADSFAVGRLLRKVQLSPVGQVRLDTDDVKQFESEISATMAHISAKQLEVEKLNHHVLTISKFCPDQVPRMQIADSCEAAVATKTTEKPRTGALDEPPSLPPAPFQPSEPLPPRPPAPVQPSEPSPAPSAVSFCIPKLKSCNNDGTEIDIEIKRIMESCSQILQNWNQRDAKSQELEGQAAALREENEKLKQRLRSMEEQKIKELEEEIAAMRAQIVQEQETAITQLSQENERLKKELLRRRSIIMDVLRACEETDENLGLAVSPRSGDACNSLNSSSELIIADDDEDVKFLLHFSNSRLARKGLVKAKSPNGQNRAKRSRVNEDNGGDAHGDDAGENDVDPDSSSFAVLPLDKRVKIERP